MKLRMLSNGDDWEGLYVDNVLVAEGHKVRLEDILRHIPNIDFKMVFIEGYFDEWGGRCPEKWEKQFDELEE